MKKEIWMEKDPALYADMRSHLQSGEWQIIYESPTALWLKWNRGWLNAVAAFDRAEALRIRAGMRIETAVPGKT